MWLLVHENRIGDGNGVGGIGRVDTLIEHKNDWDGLVRRPVIDYARTSVYDPQDAWGEGCWVS